jgi:hypothetical protein
MVNLGFLYGGASLLILDCWLPFPYTDVTFEQSGAIDGPVHPAYNPYFSACFFSKNSVFL